MPKQALPVSSSLAELLRARRLDLSLSLRDVEAETRHFGIPIPFTTLGKIERGVVDPGAFRLNLLCRIYGIPLQVAGDALDLEDSCGPLSGDESSTSTLLDEAKKAWTEGNIRGAVATLAALRRRTGDSELDRQTGLLHFSIVAGSMGKYQLAKCVVEDLLLAPPEPKLLVRILVQAAVCWHRLGSGEVALGLLARARENLSDDDALESAYVAHETASVLTTLGQLERADERLQEALSAYRRAENAHGEGIALGIAARLAMERGQHSVALERADLALEHARRNGLKRLVTLRLIDRASALVELGRCVEALESLDKALAHALMSQDEPAQFFVHHARWKARIAAGDRERAKLELGAAQYAVRHVDENCPEAREVRDTAGSAAGPN